MANIQLNINPNTKDLGDDLYNQLYDYSNNGIEVIAKSDDFPMPWDAVCYIEEGMFILEGDLGQQGAHRGYAKTAIPLDRVKNYLTVVIHVREENESTVRELLQSYGWL